MASNPTVPVPRIVDADQAYWRFRQRVLAEFAMKLDEWLIKADAAFARPTVEWTDGGTLADLLKPTTIKIDADAMRAQVDAVFDLAYLCSHFVTGELWVRAFYQHRNGSTVDEAMQASIGRARQTIDEAHDRKWIVGLRAIDGGRLGQRRIGEQSGESEMLGSAYIAAWDLPSVFRPTGSP